MSTRVSQDPYWHKQSSVQSKKHPKLGLGNARQERWLSPGSEEPLSATESPKPSLAAWVSSEPSLSAQLRPGLVSL